MPGDYQKVLESLLRKVYESRMDLLQRVEMLERALDIMACSLAIEPDIRERLIAVAKSQALDDMLMPPERKEVADDRNNS